MIDECTKTSSGVLMRRHCKYLIINIATPPMTSLQCRRSGGGTIDGTLDFWGALKNASH